MHRGGGHRCGPRRTAFRRSVRHHRCRDFRTSQERADCRGMRRSRLSQLGNQARSHCGSQLSMQGVCSPPWEASEDEDFCVCGICDGCPRRAHRCRHRCGGSRGVRTSFCLGFAAGVGDELERHSVALMVVTPSCVEEAFEARTAGCGSFADRSALTDLAAYGKGRRAGSEAVRSRSIEGQHSLGS